MTHFGLPPREFGQVRRGLSPHRARADRNTWELTCETACSMRSPRLSTEQRRALQLLASSRYGVISEEQFIHGHGFSRRVLAELIRAGFATAEQKAMAADRTVEVVRLRITAAGRRALTVAAKVAH